MTNQKHLSKLTIAAAAALAASTAITTNGVAKADTVQDKNTTPDAKATEVKQTPEQAAQKADQNYNQAQKALADASQKASAANTAKTIAGQNVEKAQKQNADANKDVQEAQALNKTAQNGGIDKAKDQVKSDQTKLSAAQDAAKTAKNTFDQKANAESNAQKDVTSAQNVVTLAHQKVTNAQQDVTSAQDVYKNAKSGAAKTALDEAKNDTLAKQKAAKQASLDKTDADNNVAAAQKRFDDTASKQASAQKAADKSAQDKTAAQTKLNEAKTAVSKAKSAHDDAQKATDKIGMTDKITINQAYKDIFTKLDKEYTTRHAETEKKDVEYLENLKNPTTNDYTHYTDLLNAEYDKIINGTDKNNETVKQIQEITANLYRENSYKGNAADHDRIVDLDHLTDEQKLELNKYALQLINGVQRQMGRPEYTLSEGSMNVAQAVADKYTEDHWSGQEKSHDYDALDAPNSIVSKKYGINAVSENMSDDFAGYMSIGDHLAPNGGQFIGISEDQTRLNLPNNKTTMYDLKGDIYNGLRAMYFENREWAHATNFFAMVESNQDEYAGGKYYMGVSFSRPDENGQEYDIHYDIYTKSDTQQDKYKEGKIIDLDLSKQEKLDEELVNKTAKALADAQKAQAEAQAEFDKAAKLYAANETALTSANADKSDAQAALIKAKAAQDNAAKALINANAKLNDAKLAQEKAQKTVDEYQKSDSDKLADVNAAKDKLAKAQTELAAAQANLARKEAIAKSAHEDAVAAKALLDASNKTVTDLQNKLAKDTETVNALTDAPKLLSDALNAQKTAEENLAKAQKAYENAEKQADEARSDLSKAQKAFETATNVKDQAHKTLDEINAEKSKKEAMDDYFNNILDNAEKRMPTAPSVDPIAIPEANKTNENTPAPTQNPAVVKTVKRTIIIKHNHLYLNGKRLTKKTVLKLMKNKHNKLVIKGTYRRLRRVHVYNAKGKRLVKKINLAKKHYILGFKMIKHHLMVKISKNLYVRYSDLF